MDEKAEAIYRNQSRKTHNEEFVQRLLARRPHLRQRYNERVKEIASKQAPEIVAEAAVMPPLHAAALGMPPPTVTELVAETIVFEERPVLFVKDDWIDTVNVTKKGVEAEELVADLETRRATIGPMVPLIGRIDVAGFPGTDFVGTGWFVDTDIVVTNRHVASLIARWDGHQYVFSRSVAGRPLTPSLSTLHEFDDLATDVARDFTVKEVLYIEPESGPNDIAFLRVERRTDGSRRDRIPVGAADAADNIPVVVIGYPARAPRSVIPNQDLMKELYRDRYDVKRAAPGYTMGTRDGVSLHDCTTLGGNSGSVVLDLKTGEAVGLHFAGLYRESNRAVRASVLSDYVTRKRWTTPPVIETPKRPKAVSPPARQAPPTPKAVAPAAPGGAVTVTIPLSITVSLGQPVSGPTLAKVSSGAATTEAADIEAAVKAFWDQRPEGVIAARVGFQDDGDAIGDTPCIAASVAATRLAEIEATGPTQFQGFDVRYIPANVAEQIDAMPAVESVDSIDYDDNARTGKAFSFEPVEESMVVRAHVGPEYSWDELKAFLGGAKKSLVSAIYEFHAPQIKDAIEARLKDTVSLKLVMDNASFTEVKDEDEEFDRFKVFNDWQKKFKTRFERIVAPEGTAGLISDSYHIKVTVREDDTFWLSSGNWKKTSSQPVITQEQRDNATDTDLPGNREWHVVINNKTLATRFRNHILQDLKRSGELGGGPVPKSKEAADILVDIPIEETVVLERRPPSRVLKPLQLNGSMKVKPLLTPDKEGAVFSEAVLELIRSAKKSLLFQIPYIGMPSNPRTDRGFIDELIKALTQKLKTLDDARVILRVGGSRFSAPTHAAWFFKSKGVDIDERLRQIDNSHTKGMIVDGKRLLLGSHNWSKPGVTLNRDASLIFDDERIAGYYAEAFEIDWERSNPIRPRRFVKTEAVMQEAVGDQPPPGFRRVRLSELHKDDD
jgi:PLD-like domain/Trypsin-like peptidase domain